MVVRVHNGEEREIIGRAYVLEDSIKGDSSLAKSPVKLYFPLFPKPVNADEKT